MEKTKCYTRYAIQDMRFRKILLNSILILILALVQTGFISGLPSWFGNFNLSLIILLFILVMGGLNLSLWWVIGTGTLLDIFSFEPFGTHLFSLVLTIVIVNFLLVHFFTNRSLYSFLALTFFGSLFYEFFSNSIGYFLSLILNKVSFLVLDERFWTGELKQLILNLFGTLILFYAFNFLSVKLKPVFLIKR